MKKLAFCALTAFVVAAASSVYAGPPGNGAASSIQYPPGSYTASIEGPPGD